jgi:MFS family permease
VVVGWLVLELTNSPWQVSLVGFCRSAPFLVCGFVSGPLTDRFGRRRIILGAQLANFLAYRNGECAGYRLGARLAGAPGVIA